MNERHKSHHHHPNISNTSNSPKVEQVDIGEIETVDDYITALSQSGVFAGGHLASVIDVLYEAEQDGASFMVGLAGAMIPGGMRKIIADAIRQGRIQALTTTGANITHDLIEAFGGEHIREVEYETDYELRKQGIDRVYDSFVAEGGFEGLESHIKPLLEQLFEENPDEQIVMSSSELIRYLGENIDDPESIVKAAYDENVPIFVPAISDSVLGLQIWLFSQFNSLIIDTTKDLGKIQDIFHESESNCAVLYGGGVPKNFTLQSALMASKHYEYAIQVTMDRVETGGLSGASLDEAISWGKIEPDAKTATATTDLTIALPLIYSVLKMRERRDT